MEHNANMAFGDPIRITFTCPDKHIPIVIDAFGKGVQFKERKDGQHDCTVYVPEFDMKLFAMQHAGFIRVTAPQDLADQIRDDLKSALEKYDQEI